MVKFKLSIVIGIIFLIWGLFSVPRALAAGNSFVTVINPVRGPEFWDINNQRPETAVEGQIQILKQFELKATWLLRFDALNYKIIIDDLKVLPDEKGLFLEITPSWASASSVQYQKGLIWHDAKSAFLTGYSPVDREKLIDTAFEKFKQTFGSYPKAVGAWWIDAYSLDYMQKKYGITSSMIVSDQYTTDNYQIWGQYFSTPYYPSKNNALHPAQSKDNKLSVVMLQWAPRDPVNAYGNGVFESTFSVQPNDYLDYHNLDTKYFSKLLDLYANQRFNSFSQIVVGLENSYQWGKYSSEYQNQMKVLSDKRSSQQLSIVSMDEFSAWYKQNFPDLSPAQLIIADDPLGSFKKVVWFMNPYYRAGWFYNSEGSLFRDIRQYIDGEQELCFREKCSAVNFATSATRVLDEVSFGQKLLIDQGKIANFQVSKNGEKFVITYQNEAGKIREIGLLPRDIEIDGKVASIDTTILDATKNSSNQVNPANLAIKDPFIFSLSATILAVLKFLIFLIICILIPGIVLTRLAFNHKVGSLKRIFLAVVSGLVTFTLMFYLFALLKITPLIYLYFLISALIFFRYYLKDVMTMALPKISHPVDLGLVAMVMAGTIFQVIPTFQSGLQFSYGLGFWGPNTHDGMWHLALINQLLKQVPPQNPIFAASILKNYHYLYDLLVAATAYFSKIAVTDLVFRFYPLLFSLMLGIGTYYLLAGLLSEKSLVKTKIISLFSLYFIYFAGSFGWIVEYLRERHLGGESAFWANQSISFNLNPPFAISLIIVIAILQLLPVVTKKDKLLIFILTLLCGGLISFKAYAGILILLTLIIVGIFKKSITHILIFVFSFIVSALLFISNFSLGQQLIVFSPFWFINSMIDSPDRVGWYRLSLARSVGQQTGNWFKFFTAQGISLFIFVVGNLGTRVFSLLTLIKIRTIFQNKQYLFLFILSLSSLIIPILFIQAGNPWNTIQFIYYFLYIAAMTSGIVIFELFSKLKKIIIVPLVLFVLVITPINSWATANGYLSNQPHAYISNQEVEALRFLKSQPEGIVLAYPYDSNLKKSLPEPWPLFVYDSTAYISAISAKPSYLEDEGQNQILLTDYKKRLVAAKDFFSRSLSVDISFLQNNNIKYIYLPKMFNVRLDESGPSIKKIFENDQVIIYRKD